MNILAFLRLTDENNQLSLTNISLMVVVVKIALTPQASLPDLGALLLGLANYAHKKVLASKEIPEAKPVDLSPLTSQLTALSDSLKDLTKDVSTLKSTNAIKAIAGR